MRKTFRKFSSPSVVMWILILFVITAVASVSYAWRLEPDKILGIAVAAAAIPIAFLTQRAVLRENQRQQLAQKAYENLQEPIDKVNSSLVSLTVSNMKMENLTTIIKKGIDIRESLAAFTGVYQSHEMVFIGSKNYFEYIHLSMMKLANLLDTISQNSSYTGYSDDSEFNEEAAKAFKKAKDLAADIQSYLYDLKKELIEDLGFSKIFNTSVDKRKPKDDRYKTLSKVATRRAIEALEKELLK